MSFLNMLGSSFTAAPNEKKTRAVQRNPISADLRIFKNGSVYPSASLVSRFNLEYPNKGDDTWGSANGFDIIDSRQLINTKDNAVPFLMIAPVNKKASKVDLFNTCTFEEDGTPTNKVTEQGSASFGKDLLVMLKEVYGITPEENGYVDMNLVKMTEVSETLAKVTNGIYYVPKTVTRGPLKGTVQYTRRENLDIYVLAPAVFGQDAAEIEETTDVIVETKETVNA
jgi:hypothetical protein